MRLDAWIASGERVPVTLGGETYDIFRRVAGRGPSITLLHGYPTSSWDFAKLAGELTGFELLAFDFLGFGDSAKPRKHRYDLIEQADLVEKMWAASGVTDTFVVAHDYGVSVIKELLARRSPALRGVVMMNGILYEEAHRPLAIQRLLGNAVTGPLVTRFVRERDFARGFASVFSDEHPVDPDELRQHWQAVSRHGGARIYDRLTRYLADGHRHAARWREALQQTAVPLHFVWGLEDPVTGPPMLAELRKSLPDARVLELPGIGHFPQIEVPARVAHAIRCANDGKDIA